MPNWCGNRMIVSGDAKEIDLFLEKAKGEGEDKDSPVCLQSLIPTPKELLDGDGWYPWRLENWGSKWDLCEVSDVHREVTTDGVTQISFYYETAWSPVNAAVMKLSELFPALTFYHEYLEEGVGFIGYETYQNGTMVEEKSCTEADLFSREGKQVKRKIGW